MPLQDFLCPPREASNQRFFLCIWVMRARMTTVPKLVNLFHQYVHAMQESRLFIAGFVLERRVRGDLIEMFKIQEDFVCYGSNLFGRSGRTVAARSKTHRFTTRETDFFAQRVLCYWNKLPADVKCRESVTSFKSRIDSFKA